MRWSVSSMDAGILPMMKFSGLAEAWWTTWCVTPCASTYGARLGLTLSSPAGLMTPPMPTWSPLPKWKALLCVPSSRPMCSEMTGGRVSRTITVRVGVVHSEFRALSCTW